MRINNNVTALNTHRMYSNNNANVTKSVAKLSSGYRINSAGDDAAGLAISEKMRAQIRGLNMASKNSQDAVSLIQTAEGALQSTHDVLQRMRELATQSASDTNETSIDRNALNQEFQALKDEINDTAGTTRFNDQSLIDGTFAKNNMATAISGLGAAKYNSTWAATNVADGSYDITFTVKSVVAEVPGVAPNVATAWAGGAVTSSAGTVSATYTPATGEASHDARANGTWTLGVTGTNYTFTNGTTGEVKTVAIGALAADGGTQELDFGYAGKVTITNSHATESVNATDISAATGTVTLDEATTPITPEYAHYASLNGEEIRVENGMKTLAFKNTNISATLVNGISGAGKEDSTNLNDAYALTITVSRTSNNAMTVQTGANQGDELAISIEKMDAQNLGLRGASIESRLAASVAITQTNTAINQVSTQRAGLGALQNRLEFKISNLDTSSENLQAAESRIRDVDMAKEMTNFTKNNILAQASTAMLAQANALPQGVLQLLG